MKKILIVLALFLCTVSAHAQIITTVAGDSLEGYGSDNVPATTTSLNSPTGVAVDAAGNIYIVDRYDSRIRKVNTSGIITTIAGTGTVGFSGDGGPATAAELADPYCIALDNIGNVYFEDGLYVRIRKIDTFGIITTIAGNGYEAYNGDSIAATSAALEAGGLAVDQYGNIYASDIHNSLIRKINTAGIITTIAGIDTCGQSGDGGPAIAAGLCEPYGVAIDAVGNIYISEQGNNRIRKIDTFGIINTIAGTGTAGYNGDNISADSAELDQPLGIALDGSGNVYISDTYNNRIREINNDGVIATIAGTGIPNYNGDNILATTAALFYPVGIAINNSGAVYIADNGNNRIRRIGWPEGINQISASVQSLTVYPNPSQGLFTIYITSNSQEQVQITITNTLGEKVKETSAFTNTPSTIQLDQPNGIYYLSVISKRGGITNKIINIVK